MKIVKRTGVKSERARRFEVSSDREIRNLNDALAALCAVFTTGGVKVECKYLPEDEVVLVVVGTSPEHRVHVGGDSVLAAINDVYAYIWSRV